MTITKIKRTDIEAINLITRQRAKHLSDLHTLEHDTAVNFSIGMQTMTEQRHYKGVHLNEQGPDSRMFPAVKALLIQHCREKVEQCNTELAALGVEVED